MLAFYWVFFWFPQTNILCLGISMAIELKLVIYAETSSLRQLKYAHVRDAQVIFVSNT